MDEKLEAAKQMYADLEDEQDRATDEAATTQELQWVIAHYGGMRDALRRLFPDTEFEQ